MPTDAIKLCPMRHREPATANPVLCVECQGHALNDLRAAADAYPELATTVEIATRPSLGRSGHVFPGSPSPACDHADDILHVLRGAEDWLRIELDHDPTRQPHIHDEKVVAAARAYLERHHQQAMATDWAAGYAKELRRVASGVARHLPAERDAVVHLPLDGLCPACRATGLYRISGTNRVVCRACGNGMPYDDYEGHLEHLRRVAARVRAESKYAPRHVADRQLASSDTAA